MCAQSSSQWQWPLRRRSDAASLPGLKILISTRFTHTWVVGGLVAGWEAVGLEAGCIGTELSDAAGHS